MNKTPYSHKRLPRLTATGKRSFTLNDWVNDHAVQSKGRWSDHQEAWKLYTRIGGIDYESPWIYITGDRVTVEHVLIDDIKVTGSCPLKGWGEQYLREIGLRLMINKYGLVDKQFTLDRTNLIALTDTGETTYQDTVYRRCTQELENTSTGMLVSVQPTDGDLHHLLIQPQGIVLKGTITNQRFIKSEELAIPFTF